MCKPTKRPRPVAAPSPAVVLASVLDQIPSQSAKDIDTFVFDIKGDADLATLSQIWQDEAPFDDMTPSESVESEPSSEDMSMDADNKPKTFVYTAFEMVSDSKNAEAICFNEEGTVIEIRNLELLSEKILPTYFRHKNVTSFYRQLNSYGFRTTRSVAAGVVHAFSHELFLKNRSDLLCNIFRKKCLKRQARLAAKKEEQAKAAAAQKPAAMEVSPPSPMSVSSAGTSEETHIAEPIVQKVVVQKKKVREAPTQIEKLRESEVKAAERIRVLEAMNRKIAEDNRSVQAETDDVFRSMNHLVDVQTSLIEKLFGRDAASAFADQSKPFRMGGESVILSKAQALPVNVQASAREFEDFESGTSAMLFGEDELAMLESIFTGESQVAFAM